MIDWLRTNWTTETDSYDSKYIVCVISGFNYNIGAFLLTAQLRPIRPQKGKCGSCCLPLNWRWKRRYAIPHMQYNEKTKRIQMISNMKSDVPAGVHGSDVCTSNLARHPSCSMNLALPWKNNIETWWEDLQGTAKSTGRKPCKGFCSASPVMKLTHYVVLVWNTYKKRDD